MIWTTRKGFLLMAGMLIAPAPSGALALLRQTDGLESPSGFSAQILAAHNRYRAEVGAPPLRWSEALARSARAYGPQLAAAGRLVHSPRATRPGEAENLWKGSRGGYGVEAMVGYWADERRMFNAGLFPNVSRTRNWLDVSHYTQMIWPETTHVGCHLERARAQDFLICRYSPKGNRDGRWVGRAPSPAQNR